MDPEELAQPLDEFRKLTGGELLLNAKIPFAGVFSRFYESGTYTCKETGNVLPEPVIEFQGGDTLIVSDPSDWSLMPPHTGALFQTINAMMVFVIREVKQLIASFGLPERIGKLVLKTALTKAIHTHV